MSLSKPLVALGLAGAVVLGSAGLAVAQEPSGDGGATFTVEVRCADAQVRLDQMEARLVTVDERLAAATVRRDELAADGRERIADALTVRIDAVNERLPEARARVERLSGLLAEKCPAA
ncbi:MAG: hypothetical protein MUE36_12815 [Acidimicrobiales bacterium]|jgi:hypothetical protein|nr:hypothetical protein [Acidimicrobiales bacterium]